MRRHLPGTAAVGQPFWLRQPADPDALVERLWPSSARKRADGVLEIGLMAMTDLVAEHGTPVYVVDEADLRARARSFRDAFVGCDVYYAGKAFLCRAVARWVVAEGLRLDVCTGGELGVALAAGVPADHIALHGNNKSYAELEQALRAGVGRIVVDSATELDRLVDLTGRLDVTARVLVRVTVGVEAHTHDHIATAHEDQKFGFSLAAGDAFAAARRVLSSERLALCGLHSHIGSQIFDPAGFEVAARRVLGLHARLERDLGRTLPELDLGGGFGIAYTSQDDPSEPAALARALTGTVERECAALGVAVPRLAVEPGRAVTGPATCTVYEVGTTKLVPLDGGLARRYISVDGGMSDNVRAALYAADFSCTLASRRSGAPPVLSRVVGRHCEAGDVVVRDEFLPSDVRPGDLLAVPATGAYCRSMASNYNHVPRPAVVSVRDGTSRVLLRRETDDDLLRLDVG